MTNIKDHKDELVANAIDYVDAAGNVDAETLGITAMKQFATMDILERLRTAGVPQEAAIGYVNSLSDDDVTGISAFNAHLVLAANYYQADNPDGYKLNWVQAASIIKDNGEYYSVIGGVLAASMSVHSDPSGASELGAMACSWEKFLAYIVAFGCCEYRTTLAYEIAPLLVGPLVDHNVAKTILAHVEELTKSSEEPAA